MAEQVDVQIENSRIHTKQNKEIESVLSKKQNKKPEYSLHCRVLKSDFKTAWAKYLL